MRVQISAGRVEMWTGFPTSSVNVPATQVLENAVIICPPSLWNKTFDSNATHEKWLALKYSINVKRNYASLP